MKNKKRFWRTSLLFFLSAALCGSFALPGGDASVRAAPQLAPSTTVVISQIYGGGGNSGATYTNDFVELFNLGSSEVPINGWSIQYASATATSFSSADVINLSGSLLPGQHYLVQLASGGTAGNPLPTPDLISPTNTNMSATAGKVVLVNTTTVLSGTGCPFSASVVDFVGYGTGTNCSESTAAPAPSNTTADVRSTNECIDTDNNSADFMEDTPNPRNTSTLRNVCLKVVGVTSSTLNGTYIVGDPVIKIDITFSNNVNVDLSGGTPTLTLETGGNDTKAIYASGSGTSTLTFTYTIQPNDVSSHLDYVATNSLSLNGGTIIGAVGNADLTLPSPGTLGSLGFNKSIIINNQSPPNLFSFTRTSTSPTNTNTLTFHATFSEPVTSVDATDFVVSSVPVSPSTVPTTATVTSVSPDPASMSSSYDVTISGGDLSTFNGSVGLSLSAAPTIADSVGASLSAGQPAINETYTVDHVAPSVINFDLAAGQAASTGETPINFTVTFSEEISSFTVGAIATVPGVTWRITDSGDHKKFVLSAIIITAAGTTTLQPTIQTNQVKDIAGNLMASASTSANAVAFDNSFPPTVTINQAVGQADPTTIFPIKFTVIFSEAINPNTFTTSDITQTGIATGVTWAIADSGDHTNFTVSATAATIYGTIVPTIAANRVTDLVGNNNSKSTSSDNTVTYTLTPTVNPGPTILINEVAWAGTSSNNPNDEWIELYNPGSSPVDITDWKLYGDDNTVNKIGTPNITLKGTIPAKGYFLLERDEAATNVPSAQVYSSGDLLNTGERLILKDNSGNTIDIANSDGGAWPAGTAGTTTVYPPSYATMERVEYANLWVSFGGIPYAKNRDEGPINGTPGNGPANGSTPGTNWISATTITTITSDSPDPSATKQNVTVTVSVVGGTTIPTGTVSITGADTNCTVTLSNGVGSCIVNFKSAGTKTITATYNGDTAPHPRSQDTETHQVTSSGAAVKTPTPLPAPPPPLIAINEFVPRPGHDWNNDGVVNVGDEYIELLNHGTIDVNLSGYRLDDEANIGSEPYALPSKVLKPGERIVFYGSETGLLLSDGGDGVRLLKPNGQLGDAYNYLVAAYPDQSYCRLPDNGGADDWNQNCFPTPGLQNSLNGDFTVPVNGGGQVDLCPIADTLPDDFILAECDAFGNNIWRSEFWDRTGWFDEKYLPGINSKSPVFAD